MTRSGKLARTLAALLILMVCAGCGAPQLGIDRVSPGERLVYDRGVPASGGEISRDSANHLANFVLTDSFKKDPAQCMFSLENIFAKEPRPEYLSAMCEVALASGLRFRSEPETALRYYVSALIYSCAYLASDSQDASEEAYRDERLRVMHVYNTAVAELFDYLKERGLARKDSYTLEAVCGQKVKFQPPEFVLPVRFGAVDELLLCADYRPRNFNHISRRFGIGAPLIVTLKADSSSMGVRYAQDQTIPATLVINVVKSDEKHDAADFRGRLRIVDSRGGERAGFGAHELPLAQDFSTPLAYMVSEPAPLNKVSYMLYPEKGAEMQGLYLFEPYSPDRIPVVLVHGLMSNTRTWMQMINTLRYDPELRKYYQFWGFSYSSGNPVLISALEMRDALEAARKEIEAQGYDTGMFSRMVLVGHSMGGLLSKTAIMDSGDLLIDELRSEAGKEAYETMPEEEREFVDRVMRFKSLPYVSRVIFIATPHRGSKVADGWLARAGSALVRLPGKLVEHGRNAVGAMRGVEKDQKIKLPTGIDNLATDSTLTAALSSIPFRDGVKYHSIVGNRSAGGVVGGGDGLVPYDSSHLDGAESELVVKSGHSVQRNPLAIQEIRRILLEHLRSYDDLIVTDHVIIPGGNTGEAKP